MRSVVGWQYCKNPNEINEAIRNQDPNWANLYSADQIISIIWLPDQRCYQVFWKEADFDIDNECHIYEVSDIPKDTVDNTRE